MLVVPFHGPIGESFNFLATTGLGTRFLIRILKKNIPL